MDVTCLIPARLGSTRFHGKALSKINGTSMVVHTARNAIDAFGKNNVIVLTDHHDILNECVKNNIFVEITGNHNNSTERISEYISKIKTNRIVELQADEPLITKKDLIGLYEKSLITKNPTCLISPLDQFQISDENICKAITDDYQKKVVYITRHPLNSGYRHVGVYSYTQNQLRDFVSMPQTKLEVLEKIHPMKWIEIGYEYNCHEIDHFTHGVDVPSDLSVVQTYLNYDQFQL